MIFFSFKTSQEQEQERENNPGRKNEVSIQFYEVSRSW